MISERESNKAWKFIVLTNLFKHTVTELKSISNSSLTKYGIVLLSIPSRKGEGLVIFYTDISNV